MATVTKVIVWSAVMTVLAALSAGSVVVRSGAVAGADPPPSPNPNLRERMKAAMTAGSLPPGEKVPECSPRCAIGQSCIWPVSSAGPVCRKTLMSGRGCGWQHCNIQLSQRPSPTAPVFADRPHCMTGTCCVPTGKTTTGAFDGVCTFFK